MAKLSKPAMKAKSNVDYKNRSKTKKTAAEKKVGTTAGSTQLSWAVAQSSDDVLFPNGTVQIDRHLNLVNRRLYRQNKVYCAKVKLSNPNVTTTPIGIYVLRNTWAVRKALHLAKTVFDQAVSEERAQVGNARWQDFRIDTQGSNMWAQSKGTFPFLINGPDALYNPVTEGATGEYDLSQVATTDAAGVELIKGFSLRTTGISSEYSVFEEFQNMGPRTSATPVTASTGGYDRARGTDFEDANVAELLGDGNLPPYNPDDLGLSLGTWVKVGEVGRDAAGGMVTSTGYFEAPLGVVVLHGYNQKADAGKPIAITEQLIEIHCKEGDYKGVSAYDI